MRLFGIYLWRLCVLATGFMAAIMAAAGFVLLLAFSGFAQEPELQELYRFGAITLGPVVALFIAKHSFWLGLLAMGVAEIWSVRDSLYFMAVGGGIAAYGVVILRGRVPELSEITILATIAAGLVGGLVYWLLAGRNAGKWAVGLNGSGPE